MGAAHVRKTLQFLARMGMGYALTLVVLAGCTDSGGKADAGSSQNVDSGWRSLVPMQVAGSLTPYDDVRWYDLTKVESKLSSEVIQTLWFNQNTIWPASFVSEADRILSAGKNPGLGLRALHAQGITGAGVAVAIIDQNICLDNPEYAGKVVEYHDVGTDQPADRGSMHGPAVLSLLVSDSMGTAPGAKVYFVAAPSWTGDAQFQADALMWIVEKNRQLPVGSKIRAVSISAAPSGPGTPFKSNNAAWDAARTLAESEGILVLDCTADHGHATAGYRDLESPDDISKFSFGFPGIETEVTTERIYVPTSRRTTAEEYFQGQFAFQFTGRGGLSWGIPYLTGVLALGWQLRPELTGEQMLDLVFRSAYVKDGAKIINPPAFIDSVRAF